MLNLIKILVLFTFVLGCDYDDEYGRTDVEEPQTEILKVEVNPDTVLLGDQIQVKCIIKDSTSNSFRYYWVIQGFDTVTNLKDRWVGSEGKKFFTPWS